MGPHLAAAITGKTTGVIICYLGGKVNACDACVITDLTVSFK
jgi:hypothetical protein